jgi:ABC-type multidrug transport system permease subunit
MIHRIWAVLTSRNKEFIRDRSALAWNLLFPVLVIFGFAFAFTGHSQDLFKIGIVNPAGARTSVASLDHVQFVPFATAEEALGKLRHHQIDLALSVPDHRYWISSTNPKGYLAERLVWGSEFRGSRGDFARGEIQGHEIRYVDWLIAGLLGMNMMFSALFGVGYNLIRYRKNGVLKRLRATPLTSFEFLVAQVISRLILIVGVSVLVYFGCDVVIHFEMLGSYLDLFVILLLGSVCLISLGLLIAARTSSEEFGGGLLNLISWPMMFLSGVWFSLEGAHPWVQRFAQIFPLTHFIDATRAVMTEGATLLQVMPNLLALTAMSVIFLLLGAASFKWE